VCVPVCLPDLNPLKEVRLIPTLSATEKLTFNVHGIVDNKWEQKIGTMGFNRITFMVGPWPVVIVPQMEVYLGIEAKAGGQVIASITLRQSATAGLHYTRNRGLVPVYGFQINPPDFAHSGLTMYAQLVPYTRVFPSLRIYDVAGLALDVKGYLRLKGDLALSVPYKDKPPCIDSIFAAAYWGVDAYLTLDFGPLRKILGNVPGSTPRIPIYKKVSLIRKWDTCVNQVPFMELQGSDIQKIVYLNAGDVLTTTYTVKNDGDSTMNWTATASADGITSVTPASGSLEKGQSTTVTVSVNTGNISSVSVYKNTVAFKNLYADKNTSAANNGSADRNISVNVVPKLAVPVMNTPVIATGSNGSPIPSIANLSWSYPDSATIGYVTGYYVYKDGSLIATLTKPDSVYQVANLSQGVAYSFQVKAYGNNTVGNLSTAVSVTPPCLYSISSASQSFVPSGGSGAVNVTASGACSWTAASNVSWISITSGSGTGNGTMTYSVAANAGITSRTGSMTIAGKTFTVTQSGVSCTYSITPTSNAIIASGGNGSVSVTALSGCVWTATSNASWITITSGSSGNGNGTVAYSVAQNTSTSSRTGTLAIAGQTFTITQAGCTYSISSASQSFTASGGSGTVNVTSGCAWTATSNEGWITVNSGSSGNGNGTVTYSVTTNKDTLNSGTSPRTGTITIAGQTFTVTQSGISCTYSLNPTMLSSNPTEWRIETYDYGSVYVSGSIINVTAPTDCKWTAKSNVSWIILTSGSSGNGNGMVVFDVQPVGGLQSRTGTMTIAGKTYTIMQIDLATGR